MKLKNSLVWVLLCLVLTMLASCSFTSDEKLNPKNILGANDLKIDPLGDSDGDRVKDAEEASLGRNPFVAELPDLKVRFLQNYKIEVFYHPSTGDPLKDQKSFVINTDVLDTNPDFKFRVGWFELIVSSLKKLKQIQNLFTFRMAINAGPDNQDIK